ncbi:MAG: hypothetical protein WAU52_11150 [Burkholderiales bacterium]
MLLALVFVLLRPVCDAFAASGDVHAARATGQAYVSLSGAALGDHAHNDICCSSVDAGALVKPAVPPPVAFTGEFAAPSRVILQFSTSVAQTSRVVARRDPAPPLSYHARSLRRLD